MNGCKEYGLNIQYYIDKELSVSELENFRLHLEKCTDCRQEVEAEEEFSRLLQRTRQPYTAPSTLRDRLAHVTAEWKLELFRHH